MKPISSGTAFGPPQPIRLIAPRRRAAHAQVTSPHSHKKEKAEMLSKTERAVCAQLGLTESDYLGRKRGTPLALSVHAQTQSVGGVGRQAVAEALEALDLPQPDKVSPEDMISSALEAIDGYNADPDDPEGWMDLARAGAYVERALDAIAPGYAQRHAGGGSGDAGAEDDEGSAA